MSASFSNAMIAWYEQNGRKNLPWQLHRSPYHTWLSEVMLQQTQVATVIPYYERFTETFPDIHALANAKIDEVLHLWTGLGYYSRARNLHKCAQLISQQYQGKFPNTVEGLEALPGIGRSTAGAILSLSMDIPAPILDGNVKRVFCRYQCVEGWSGDSKVQKQLWHMADTLLPKKQVKEYNQSLMDLGANVCKRSKPLCEICPLAPQCQSYEQKSQHLFPQSKPRKSLPEKQAHMLMLQKADGSIYLEQRPPQGLWGGLWSLPEFSDMAELKRHCKQQKLPVKSLQTLEPIKHTFSHFHLFIHPVLCHIEGEPARIANSNSLWYQPHTHKLGLATPIKKLIKQVQA